MHRYIPTYTHTHELTHLAHVTHTHSHIHPHNTATCNTQLFCHLIIVFFVTSFWGYVRGEKGRDLHENMSHYHLFSIFSYSFFVMVWYYEFLVMFSSPSINGFGVAEYILIFFFFSQNLIHCVSTCCVPCVCGCDTVCECA